MRKLLCIAPSSLCFYKWLIVEKNAALYVTDADARRTLVPLAINTVRDREKITQLSQNILELAHPNAASDIADEVLRLAEGN